eukprot:6181874-Pleurochrysis_carterae.AAC.2
MSVSVNLLFVRWLSFVACIADNFSKVVSRSSVMMTLVIAFSEGLGCQLSTFNTFGEQHHCKSQSSAPRPALLRLSTTYMENADRKSGLWNWSLQLATH